MNPTLSSSETLPVDHIAGRDLAGARPMRMPLRAHVYLSTNVAIRFCGIHLNQGEAGPEGLA